MKGDSVKRPINVLMPVGMVNSADADAVKAALFDRDIQSHQLHPDNAWHLMEQVNAFALSGDGTLILLPREHLLARTLASNVTHLMVGPGGQLLKVVGVEFKVEEFTVPQEDALPAE